MARAKLPWLEEEDYRLMELRRDGLSWTEVARILAVEGWENRTDSACCARYNALLKRGKCSFPNEVERLALHTPWRTM